MLLATAVATCILHGVGCAGALLAVSRRTSAKLAARRLRVIRRRGPPPTRALPAAAATVLLRPESPDRNPACLFPPCSPRPSLPVRCCLALLLSLSACFVATASVIVAAPTCNAPAPPAPLASAAAAAAVALAASSAVLALLRCASLPCWAFRSATASASAVSRCFRPAAARCSDMKRRSVDECLRSSLPSARI